MKRRYSTLIMTFLLIVCLLIYLAQKTRTILEKPASQPEPATAFETARIQADTSATLAQQSFRADETRNDVDVMQEEPETAVRSRALYDPAVAVPRLEEVDIEIRERERRRRTTEELIAARRRAREEMRLRMTDLHSP